MVLSSSRVSFPPMSLTRLQHRLAYLQRSNELYEIIYEFPRSGRFANRYALCFFTVSLLLGLVITKSQIN